MIRVLPVEVANRIAAGEVVERPASVVKELVENALDAGARDVSVEIEDGGAKLIRVVDDGFGMSPDDLARSVLPHATSKISDVDDLFRVATYGFRGEALPSIGAVARLELRTRPRDADLGARLTTEGGTTRGPEACGGPFGTAVEVRNLFYNVPARRLFLKQDRTEAAQVAETLTRLALPDPGWSLTLRSGGRRTLEAPAAVDRRARIAALFGAATAERLHEAEGFRGTAKLHAFFGPPDLVRPTASRQYLFLNGRPIRDRRLSHALQEAYRGLIMPKEFPTAFLFLTVDPATVDVNVHPAKSEVRFRDADALHALVFRTLRERLDAARDERRYVVAPSASGDDAFLAGDGGAGTPAPSVAVDGSRVRAPSKPIFAAAVPMPRVEAIDAAGRAPATVDGKNRLAALERGLYPDGAPAPARFLQVHRSYVVVEAEGGVRILDQHALHERKLFDALKARFAARDAEDQLLLVPRALDVGPGERAALLEHAPEFARLGLRLEPFGATGVAVRSLPAALRRADVDELAAAALELALNGAVRRDALVEEAMATFACKAAVKFNDSLPPDEIRALLDYEARHPEARNCPHGRNTSLFLSLADLESRFQRKK